MNKLFFQIIIFCVLCHSLYAQTITVLDSAAKKPLAFVSLYSASTHKSATGDYKGRVDIGIFQNSPSIEFRLLGYEKKTKTYDEILENNSIVYMRASPLKLGDVVVSANRWNDYKSETPFAMELISSREIEFNNPQTAADMLNQSGAVYVQKSQLGGGSPMIRGFATNRVLIVVDNVRMNNAIFRSGNLHNIISLDANAIENAQVIFNPGSAIYGSDAIGGVMAFNTKSPQISYGGGALINGGALLRYSSANNEKTTNVSLNAGFEKFGSFSSFSLSEFGDLRMGSDGPDDYLRPFYQARINGRDTAIVNSEPELQKGSAYSLYNITQKFKYKPDHLWEFEAGVIYSRTTDIPRYDRLIEKKGALPKDAEWRYGPQIWSAISFAASNYSATPIYDVAKTILSFQFFEESRHDRKFNASSINHRTENVKAYSVNIDLVKEIDKSSNLFYGLEGVFNNIKSSGESENIISGSLTPISSRYPDGSIWNSYGAYVSYKNRLADKLILQTSLRYSYIYINSDFDTAFFPLPFTNANIKTGSINGGAGVSYNALDELNFFLNLSTGFRAPNVDDIGKSFDSEPGAVVVPNPNLKSEYIYNCELGAAAFLFGRAQFDIAGFYSYLDGALVRRNFKLNGLDSVMYDGTLSRVQAIQNAAFAYVYGIQAGIKIQITDNIEFVSKINYQKGEEEDDSGVKTPLRHAAPFFGTASLSFSYNIFHAAVYADYNSEISYDNLSLSERTKTAIYAKDENGNPYSPAWFTLNLKSSARLFEGMSINFGVENIFDKRYRTYSSGICAPGRNFIVSARYEF